MKMIPVSADPGGGVPYFIYFCVLCQFPLQVWDFVDG